MGVYELERRINALKDLFVMHMLDALLDGV